jgi:hypothetical protein
LCEPFAKELAVKTLLSCGVLAASLLFCLGCGGSSTSPEVQKETEELYESEDYEKQMMGEMGGEGESQ